MSATTLADRVAGTRRRARALQRLWLMGRLVRWSLDFADSKLTVATVRTLSGCFGPERPDSVRKRAGVTVSERVARPCAGARRDGELAAGRPRENRREDEAGGADETGPRLHAAYRDGDHLVDHHDEQGTGGNRLDDRLQ